MPNRALSFIPCVKAMAGTDGHALQRNHLGLFKKEPKFRFWVSENSPGRKEYKEDPWS